MPCCSCNNWERRNNFGYCKAIISNDWVGIDDDNVSIDARSKDRKEINTSHAVISVGDGHADSTALITGQDFSCI
jgi:hypothetical protein